MDRHDGAGTFSGQLQRGRGSARRGARGHAEAEAAVYRCVIDDLRWDPQVEERDGYLAGLIQLLGLPLTPIEQHLSAVDGKEPDGILLALNVLAVLPFAGRPDAAAVLRRYVLAGRHWAAAEAICDCGALKLPGLRDGLGDDIVASHDDEQLASFVGRWPPWTALARTQPRIRRLLRDAVPEYPAERARGSQAANPPLHDRGPAG
jgi:hypothetical protein